MKKIIIADDEEGIRKLYELLVEFYFADYEPELFESGNELESRLKQEIENPKRNIVAIVLDNVIRPGKTGSELIEEYSGKIKVPMGLCYGGDDVIGKMAVENGAVGYLKKPFTNKEFTDFINGLIDSKR